MRIEMHGRRALSALFVGLVCLATSLGCEDNPPPPEDLGESPIALDEIILTPKSPEPGDTISLTAVITSANGGANLGDYPTVEWGASDGVFLENNQLSVRWQSPPASGLFSITCKATNSVNSVSLGTQVFVGSPSVIVADRAGEIHLTGTGDDFYYLSGDDPSQGTAVSSYLGGVQADVSLSLGESRVFSPDVSRTAHSVFTIVSGHLDQEKNVVLLDLGTGVEAPITSDPNPPSATRHNQYDYPAFSPGSDLVTYQGLKPFPIKGSGVDSIDVFIYDIAAMTTQVPTFTHGQRRRNLFPTFSSDGNWLVFVSDRTGIGRWELYGLRMTGGVADSDSAQTVRLTTTSGRITVTTPVGTAKPPMKWSPSPAQPVAAVLSADEILYLVAMTGSGATQTTVTGIEGRVRQFVWAPDGQSLAVTNFAKIYQVDLSGTVAEIHTAVSGDRPGDMAWSPDGLWLVYRVLRGGGSWFELLDVDAGVLTQPAVITAVTATTNVSSYGLRMNIGAGYSDTNELFLLEWAGNATTPRITRLNISGVVQ